LKAFFQLLPSPLSLEAVELAEVAKPRPICFCSSTVISALTFKIYLRITLIKIKKEPKVTKKILIRALEA
jgi:hypothetical protein